MPKKKFIYKKAIKKFRKADFAVLWTTVFAKFLFGVGLGFLLASYLTIQNLEKTGWIIIVISLILHIPIIYEIFFKK